MFKNFYNKVLKNMTTTNEKSLSGALYLLDSTIAQT